MIRRYVEYELDELMKANRGTGKGKNKGKGLTYLDYCEPEIWFVKKSLEMASQLVDEAAKNYSSLGYSVAVLKFELITQGIVGVSEGPFKPIFEVGLSIDPILGLPYYRGSSIKGAVRSFFESLVEREAGTRGGKSNARKELVNSLFGPSSNSEQRASLVVFGDMYPIGCTKEYCSIYKKFIITPHYFKGGKVVDNEFQARPNPITFIGIEEGTVFKTFIAISNRYKLYEERFSQYKSELGELINRLDLPDLTDPSELLKYIAALTIVTLRTGIAARSNKGYNVFEPAYCLDECYQRFKLLGYELYP